jgi:hypothetical protein
MTEDMQKGQRMSRALDRVEALLGERLYNRPRGTVPSGSGKYWLAKSVLDFLGIPATHNPDVFQGEIHAWATTEQLEEACTRLEGQRDIDFLTEVPL